MKKYIPLVLVGLGVLVVAVAGLVIMKSMKRVGEVSPEEVSVPELSRAQWPVVSLIPSEDPAVPNSLGHFLDFKVQGIDVPGADSMDYLLVYTTSDGGQQGAPGTVKLTGGDVERKLLLGSASSGKYRFDAGVSTGTMTITFRDAKGKSMGKLTTAFHMQLNETVLTSVDGKFTYTLDKAAKGVYFITMPTFAQPDPSIYVAWSEGYGVFASDGLSHPGK